MSLKFTRLVQTIFILAGFGLLFLGKLILFPAYYRPVPMALAAFFYVFLIELPSIILKKPDSLSQKSSLIQFQSVLALGLGLCGLGSLGLWGLYQAGIPYDKFVHFSFPLMLLVSGAFLFRSWFGWSFRKSWLVPALIIAASAVGWEYVEAIFAQYFHFGFFGQLFDHDSMFDIYSNFLGVGAAIAIIYWHRWAKSNLSV